MPTNNTHISETTGENKWKLLFGTEEKPSSKYLTLTDNVDLQLAYTPYGRYENEFRATIHIQLPNANVWHTITLAKLENTPENWNAMQKQTIQTAKEILSSLQTRINEALQAMNE